jgi:hypothetical protein
MISVNIFLNLQENRLHQTSGIGEDFRPQQPGEGRGLIQYAKGKPPWN